MSFERPLPPPLPPDGYLLAELGYLEEPKAALAIKLSPQTLVEYRKSGYGPSYTVIGRSIFYSKENLQKWLDNGGTRPSIESGAVPDPTARKPQAKKLAGVVR